MVDINIALDNELSYIEKSLLYSVDDYALGYFESSLHTLYRLAIALDADEFIIKRIHNLIV